MVKNNKGFTIIELILAVCILSLVVGVLMKMFVVSSKVNRSADEIDKANMIATNKAEQIKKDPNKFLNSLKTKIEKKDSSDKDKKITTGSMEEYYDYNWEKTDKANAKFVLTSSIINENKKAESMIYMPKITYISGEAKLVNQCHNYFVVAVEALDKTTEHNITEVDHNYEIYIIQRTPFDRAPQTYYAYSPNTYYKGEDPYEFYKSRISNFYEQYLREGKKNPWLWGKMGATREIQGAIGHICDNGKRWGTRFVWWQYDKKKKNIKNVKGSIPISIRLEKSSKEYNLTVVNATDADLDLYFYKEDEETKVNIDTKEGNSTVTQVDSNHQKEESYDINVVVTRKKDNCKLADYTTQKYKPN